MSDHFSQKLNALASPARGRQTPDLIRLTGLVVGEIFEKCPCLVEPARASPLHVATDMRNNSAPPKWSKLWTDIPRPGDHIGAYSTEQLERMNQEFTAAVERAFRVGGESEMAATATYDQGRRNQIDPRPLQFHVREGRQRL
jgi:hypothetical protein